MTRPTFDSGQEPVSLGMEEAPTGPENQDSRQDSLPGDIAGLLVQDGVITAEQLAYAKRVRTKLPAPRPVLQVLQDLRYVTREQLQNSLRAHRHGIRLGSLLVELGHLRERDLEALLEKQKERKGVKLGELVVESRLMDEGELLEVLSFQFGMMYIPAPALDIDLDLARKATLGWYDTYRCIPVEKREDQVVVAFSDPLDDRAFDAARKIFGDDLLAAISRPSAIKEAIVRLTSGMGPGPGVSASENQIVGAVNNLIAGAAREGASDIHLEPMRDLLRVRLRLDGVLVPFMEFPAAMISGITSRIKIMAKADIAEKRRHQDGRILFEFGNQTLDIRVSFYITLHGEKIVLRLLNNRSRLLDIQSVGMAPRMLQRFIEDALDAPSGVVIITGPTGSGKTTTLYSSINYLNDTNTSIITAEDPVEYVIDGISQCSINPKISVTYEETLRHIVRQDPDVIVIGEIRDLFSAETAIQAALTGHKVLTTFHTEDSIGGLLRLLNMNIEAFLISSTVVSVVAQRLLRRVCPLCADEARLSPYEVRRLGYEARDLDGVVLKVPRGCAECRYTGYKGRVAIFELLVLNETVKDALIARKTSYEIRRISTQTSGLVTLLEDGIVKAIKGETTFEEIIHRLPRLARPRPLAELKRLLGEIG